MGHYGVAYPASTNDASLVGLVVVRSYFIGWEPNQQIEYYDAGENIPRAQPTIATRIAARGELSARAANDRHVYWFEFLNTFA